MAPKVAPDQGLAGQLHEIFARLVGELSEGDLPPGVALKTFPTEPLVAAVALDGQTVLVGLREMERASEFVRAFLLGHELGHVLQLHHPTPLANRGAKESMADLVGLELARRVGYGESCTEGAAFLYRLNEQRGDDARRLCEALSKADRRSREAALSAVIPGYATVLSSGTPLARLTDTALDHPLTLLPAGR